MELRHIRYFLAIAEHASFTRAAQVVHVTQSTLSHQVQQLEQELGYRLFDRCGRTVTLTRAGEAFLPGARCAIRELDNAIRAVKGAAGGLTGKIALLIGAHVFATDILPFCLSEFARSASCVQISVHESLSQMFRDDLMKGDYAFGIGEEDPASRCSGFEPLYSEEFGLTVSREHPMAKRKRLRMIELHRLPVVLPSREIAARRIFDDCLQLVGAQPTVVAELNLIDTLYEVARWTKTHAVLAADSQVGDDLVFIPIDDPKPERIVGVHWKVESAQCRLFVDIVHRVIATMDVKKLPRWARMRPCVSRMEASSAN